MERHETSGIERAQDMKKEQEQNIQAGYYIVDLIRAVLKNETPKAMPEGVTPKDIYMMAKKHSVDCIVYRALEQLPEKAMGAYAEQWKKHQMQCAMQGVVQLAERDRLYQMFTEAGIRILPLKGCLMKGMYPKQEYRQMADLDILIDADNVEMVKTMMEKSGYTYEYTPFSKYHDEYIKKPWCNVEIHNRMLPEETENVKDYDDIWQRAYEETPGSGIFRLSWDDFYIYMIDHCAKHFFKQGSGIRSVMDVYVFLKEKGQELHREYLKEQLMKKDLWEFAETIEKIAESWFEKGETNLFEETENKIILSGAHGCMDMHYMIAMDNLTQKYGSRKIAYIVRLSSRIFMKYENMCILYPILKKIPFLLPFLWIHRGFVIWSKRRYTIKKELGFMKDLLNENKERL